MTWIFVALRVLLAVMFAMAGGSKLAGSAAMVENFEKLGVGQGMRYLTGAIEVVAALLLLPTATAWVGAALLLATMVGATIAHLTRLGGTPAPAVVFGLLSALVLWGQR